MSPTGGVAPGRVLTPLVCGPVWLSSSQVSGRGSGKSSGYKSPWSSWNLELSGKQLSVAAVAEAVSEPRCDTGMKTHDTCASSVFLTPHLSPVLLTQPSTHHHVLWYSVCLPLPQGDGDSCEQNLSSLLYTQSSESSYKKLGLSIKAS